MRILKLFFITFLSATLIAGCSDGNIFDDFTDSDNVDLYIAYEKIDKGMNYEQVKTIVGSDYNDGKTEFSNEIQYQWAVNKGKDNYSTLTVKIGETGVNYKYSYDQTHGANTKFY